jgi:Ferritin-like domain
MKDVRNRVGSSINRRTFVKRGLTAAGAATVGGGLLTGSTALLAEEQKGRDQEERNGQLTRGDAAILRFLAAAEILETDLWQQYNELGGIQDKEVPGGSGCQPYADALSKLDTDMSQYIHDNTEDELSHEVFINNFLASKGADTVDLKQFRNLSSSQVPGAQQIPRLTNLMQLTVDTSWWTRYRSGDKNPDFGDTFDQAIPSLAVGQHPAIPRNQDDLTPDKHIQAIANTAGFHFGTIEQGGTSLYPQLAQRVTDPEVLRIVLSIGPTEAMHFQTWSDKAGNAPALTDPKDPSLVFPDLNNDPKFGGEEFQTNLIMPEPTIFLRKGLGTCSIVRPTETKGAAMGALKFLTAMGLFIGQTPAFFEFMRDLAEDADEARRGGN